MTDDLAAAQARIKELEMHLRRVLYMFCSEDMPTYRPRRYWGGTAKQAKKVFAEARAAVEVKPKN